MTRRLWVLAVTAWIGVVIAGSALTWLAIDSAGQQVTSSSSFTATTPTPSPTQRPDETPTTAPAKPKRTPTRSSSPVPPQTRYTWTPRPTPPPPLRSETRTWTGTAGSLTVSCTGGTVRFLAASPNNGWQVERGDLSGDSIEVKFSRTGTQLQVQASCVQGVPAFQVDSSGGGDS